MLANHRTAVDEQGCGKVDNRAGGPASIEEAVVIRRQLA